MRSVSSCRGSVTLSFEAIVLAAMIGAGVLAVAFSKQVNCQGQIDAEWVSCTNILECPVDTTNCWAAEKQNPIPVDNAKPAPG